ncbi:hypothetical protein [Mycolicibacterium sp.]|uniref:hypothetical protein n=1 Tax=Mycolicibacterium sp. TaxID=2320850 RepID=UPI0028B03C58|nr:hypothetical protein [Mycolicibacterium sp.]
MPTAATLAIGVIAVIKIASFVFVVRSALRPPPVGSADMDGPDGSWRWWEEFGPEPEPEPQQPGGASRELTRV